MLLKQSRYHSLALALATVATAILAQSASAANFNFSFSNVDGPVAGTVQGTLTLPDGDGTFAATSMNVTSVPAALGYTTPFNVFTTFSDILLNSFTVSGGNIIGSTFFANPPSGSGLNNSQFIINFAPGSVGTRLSIAGTFFADQGVIDTNSSTLTYTPVATASTPEPGTVLGLLSIAGVGLLRKRQKQEP